MKVHKSRNNIFLFSKGAKSTCSVKRVGGGEDDLFSVRRYRSASLFSASGTISSKSSLRLIFTLTII